MSDDNSNQQEYGSEELAFLFRRASRMMARGYHRRAHAHHAQEHVLSLIRQEGPIKQSELLEILDVRSSSLSEVLGKLERNGWIERRRNENDKRSFVISAVSDVPGTPSGEPEGNRENADGLFACLDAAERGQLGGLLQKLIGSLENDPLCGDAGDPECGRGMQGHRRKEHLGREFGGRFSGRGSHGGRGSRGGRAGRGRLHPEDDNGE